MLTAILMPTLSPTMTEGKLIGWLKKEGDIVDTSSILLEVETDKATMELESPVKGILGRIIIKGSENKIKVGTLIGVIAKNSDDLKDIDNFIKNYQNNNKKITEIKNEPKNDISLENERLSETKTETKGENRIKISPLAKNIAIEDKIDISNIKGSGPYGRIIKEDLENFVKNKNTTNSNNIIQRDLSLPDKIEVSNMRDIIGKRLKESVNTIPHFYLSFEIEMDRILEVKNEITELDPKLKISVGDFIIKGIALAIKKHPEFNSFLKEEYIYVNKNIDISIAVALENGLITPILQNADQKNIINISKEVKELALKAKEGKLKPEEYQGGSFTISNLGMFKHISSFTSIINMPQVAILAISSTIKKPIVNKEDQIVIKNICNMTLSSDHRIIDGVKAAEFTKTLKEILEKPSGMFL